MDFWEFIDLLPPVVFDVLELIIPLGIFAAILLRMFHDVPKEHRPWHMIRRRLTGNLTKEEMKEKQNKAQEKIELKLMASNFAFTNVPRNLLVFAIFVFMLSFAVIYLMISPMVTDDWTPTEATIVETGITDMVCQENLQGERCFYSGYFPMVEFSWEVDGVSYESERYTFDVDSVNFSYQAQAEAWLEDYPVGSTTTAYHNPDDPGDAVLITHDLMEAYLVSGNWLLQIILSIACFPLPIALLLTVRQFEKALPEHRGKRFKLSYNSASKGWGLANEDEHAELVSQARSAYLKKNYDKYDEEVVESALRMADAMDMESKSVSDGPKTFTILDGGVEKQFTARSVGDLLDFFENEGTLYLEDSREKGRYIVFVYMGEIDGDDHLQVKEFNGDELVLDESVNMERNYHRALAILVAALEKSTADDGQWWD